MKTIKLIFCLMLCTSFCYSQTSGKNKKTDLQEENLKGKVKSVRKIEYNAVEKSGEPVKTEMRYFDDSNLFVSYNVKGNKIEETEYNCDDCLLWNIVYKYDDKENRIERNVYNPDGSLLCGVVYKYDNKENLIEEKDYYPLPNKYVYIYKYDDKGNQIEANTYNPDGSLWSKYVYKYDGNGNQIEENIYYYSPQCLLLDNKTVYKYDDKGNIIENNMYFNSNSSIKDVYKYDDKGNKIEENAYEADGSLRSKDVYKYKYDEHDNWIEQQYYYNGEIKTITERTIEYYE